MDLKSIGETILARIRQRPDSEFQQTMIRFFVVIVVMSYFSSDQFNHAPGFKDQIPVIGVTLTCISLILMAGPIVDPVISIPRRLIGMLVDFSTTSYMLILTGEPGIAVVGLYLWVTLGNGFRYGMPYLIASTVATVIGFSFVHTFSPFWSARPYLWWGLLITLIAVPAYASILLRQLHQSIRREREASAAKSNFLASMSHELRTPLNVVIGVTDLLVDSDLNHNQKDLVNIAHSSASTLLELIDNILDITRIESGRVTVINENFDLHMLVNSVISMMRSLAEKKGLRLNLSLSPHVPYLLLGDNRHLRQVLINLLGNAIKFTERGWVDLNIRLANEGSSSPITFEIADTGIGIPEEFQGRIFDAFFQGDPTITRRFGGTGLGTSIAKSLVEAMGGKITLISRPGEGTVFSFELPFERLDEGSLRLDSSVRVAILSGDERSRCLEKYIRDFGGDVRILIEPHQLTGDYMLKSSVDVVIVESHRLPVDPSSFIGSYLGTSKLKPPPIILITSPGAPPDDSILVHAGYTAVIRDSITASLLFNAVHASTCGLAPQLDQLGNMRLRTQTDGIGSLRILVAEDSPVNQRVISGMLEHIGHDVILANNGEEALDILETEVCDLAIVDMHMPRMSGPDLVKRWRFMEKTRLPIIVLTADARMDAETQCMEAGVDAFLTKPVKITELVDIIAKIARRPSRKPEAESNASELKSNNVLDESVLNEFAKMGGNILIQQILTTFSVDSERSLSETQRALFGRDQSKWHDQLHILKGGAFDIGAWKLAHLCAHAERLHLNGNNRSEANQMLDEIRHALVEVKSAIEIFMGQMLQEEQV